MPIYPFKCHKCEEEYDVLVAYDEAGKYESVRCPKCDSDEKTRLVNYSVGVQFGNPEGTDKWRSHDYRFHHNLPKVIKERENAERAAKGNPYNHIDDVSSGEHFGEVK